jgi:hypothetical protein
MFGSDPAWQPLYQLPQLEPKTRGARIGYAITKWGFAGLSLFILGSAAAIAHDEHGDDWMFINLLVMVAVVFAAIRGRASWSFILLFGSAALGLSTCVANFHWRGG